MALTRYCPSCLSSVAAVVRPSPFLAQRSAIFPPTALPVPVQRRAASQQISNKKKKEKEAYQRKKKARVRFYTPDMKDATQFSLTDAMRYIRAVEVGRAPTSVKYELAMRLKTLKSGPVLRSRMRLPHPVDTSQRICVICPPDSSVARAALDAGATLVGEETVFDAIKAGNIDFDRCIAHTDSAQKLAKSGVARVLGPRGLMPSVKTGTVTKDVANSVRDMVGGTEFRERLGVLRCAIGQLGFTPEELQNNIRAFVEEVNKNIAALSDRATKEVSEVVLSSTSGPGFSLNGNLLGQTPVTDLPKLRV